MQDTNPLNSEPSNNSPLPEKKKGKGKKLLVIILVIIMLLIGAGAVSAVVYVMYKNSKTEDSTEDNAVQEEEEVVKEVTAEEAYTIALEKFTEESYYEYTSEGTLPVEVAIPAIPSLDINLDIDGTEDGKLNLEDGDSYYLTNLSVDTDTSMTEVYFIQGKVYARESLEDDFTEYSEEEASEAGLKHSAILDVITDLADDVDYTVLENETLNGREQFTYLIELTQEDLTLFVQEVNRSLESEGLQVSEDQATVTNAQVKIWIDKENITATKGLLSIGNLSLTGTYQSYSINVTLNDVEAEMLFDKWGEVEKIELPTGNS